METYMQMKNESSLSLSPLSSSSQLWSLLPEEVIIYNILFKLPVNTLLRLRCVCRYFHTLITNPSFVRQHLEAQPNLSLLPLGNSKVHYQLYDLSSSNRNVVVIHSPFEYAAILSSCNGLLFLGGEGGNKDSAYIWNPCTKEYKKLPPLPPSTTEYKHLFEETSSSTELHCRSSGFCGFGYDRTNDEYKILYHENWYAYCRNVYVASMLEFKLYRLRTDTWTSISDNPYKSFFLNDYRTKTTGMRRTGLFVNGALYWIILPISYKWQPKIISFDMEKEEFREVQKPEDEKSYRAISLQLQLLQGCLCLCQFPKLPIFGIKRVDIWILKDFWTKLFTIELPDELSTWHLQVLRFCKNGEIIMRKYGSKQLVVYNPVNQKGRQVEKLDWENEILDDWENEILDDWENEVIYKESLVSLNSDTYSI